MKKKYIFLISIILILSLVMVFIFKNNNKHSLKLVEYMETSLLPIEIDDNLDVINEISNSLKNNYYEEDDECGFYQLHLSDDNTSYVLYTMYDIYCILEMTNSEIDEGIKNIVKDAYDKMKKCELTTIDTFSEFCLYDLIYNYYDEEFIDDYIIAHTDENSGLLYENSINDSLEVKLRFTVEVLQILEKTGITLNTSAYISQIVKFYNEFEFKNVSQGDTFFNSGGLAIYLMSCVDQPIEKEKLNSWYEEWKTYYLKNPIKDVYDVMDIAGSLIPVASAFGDYNLVVNLLNEYYSSEGVESLIEELDSPQLVYDSIKYSAKMFEKNDIANLTAYCTDKTEHYLNMLKTPSIKNNFYGLELSYALGKSVDTDKLLVSSYNLLKTIFDSSNEYDTEELITNVYYYSLICSFVKTTKGNIDNKYSNIILEKMKIIDNLFSDWPINNPQILRMYIECASNNDFTIGNNTIKFLKNYVKENSTNEYMLQSCYMIDLFWINKILDTNYIDNSQVDNAIYSIEVDGLYTKENGEDIDLEATFMVYSYLSRYGEMGKIDCNHLKSLYEDGMDLSELYEYACLLNVNSF